MATRTQNRTSKRSNSSSTSNPGSSSAGASNQDRSAFSWGEGAGPVIAAALGGAMIGFAANYGRKALMQGMEAAIGDWDRSSPPSMTRRWPCSTKCWRPTERRPSSARCCS